jgi:hypothetical protein
MVKEWTTGRVYVVTIHKAKTKYGMMRSRVDVCSKRWLKMTE